MIDQRIVDVAATFPSRFGLLNFPGDVFQISLRASYMSPNIFDPNARVMLYVQRMRGDEWVDFSKGTAEELSMQIVEI